MTPRLVATDLDGTLVRRDGTLSEYTREVLVALEKRDIPVIFATGRPLRWAAELFEHVAAHGVAIVSNGALAWDVGTSEARLERAIGVERALEVAERIRILAPGTVFGVETQEGFSMEPSYIRFYSSIYKQPPVRIGPFAELLDEPALKMLAQAHDIDAERFWHAAEAAVGELAEVTWSGFESVPMLEISGLGVTKASTLETVAASFGVTAEDVVAFGDMPNDLPMLRWAGTSYAMLDAHPLVLETADHVAESNDEDGVAKALAEIFDL